MNEPSPVPDCSIIIPVWNGADFIQTAIKSALAQVDVNVEILVVDDASTDNTIARVQSLTDHRIRCIPRQVNGGPAAARNDGLDQARGRWVAVLDADDTMAEDRIARLIQAAERHSWDIVADNMWVIRKGGTSLQFDEELNGGAEAITLTDMFLEGKIFSKGRSYGYLKPLFRRDFLFLHKIRYNQSLRIGEDFQFVVDCIVNGAIYYRVSWAGYKYNARVGSISHRLKPGHVEAMAAAEIDFLARFGAKLSPPERSAIQAHLANLEDAASFNRMIHSIKSRRPDQFIIESLAHPLALRHFSMPIQARLQRLFAAHGSDK
jgi:succinoglycan biosynthesis protein ExoO